MSKSWILWSFKSRDEK